MNTQYPGLRTKKSTVSPKIAACLLILAMVVSLLPMMVFADGGSLHAPVVETIVVDSGNLKITFNKDIAALPAQIVLNQAFKVTQAGISLGIKSCTVLNNIITITPNTAIAGTGIVKIRYEADEGKILATDGTRVHSFKKTVPYLSAPRITTQPKNIRVKVGQPVTLTVAVLPVKTGSLSYQWYYFPAVSNKDDKKNFAKLGKPIDTNSPQYSLDPSFLAVAGKTYFYCEISHVVPGLKTAITRSHAAKVIVFTQMNAETPKITTQPTSLKVNINGTATLTVAATVTKGTLSYQWYKYTPKSNHGMTNDGRFRGTKVGMNSASLTLDVASGLTKTAGITYYYCVVTNTDTTVPGKQNVSVKSAVVKVTVVDPAVTTSAGSTRPTYTKTDYNWQNHENDRDYNDDHDHDD